jgi:hypothetical protein
MREMAKGLGSYNMEESPSFMSRLFKGEWWDGKIKSSTCIW